MPPEDADPEAKCPVDHKTREKWLEAAKAKGQQQPTPSHPPIASSSTPIQPSRWSLDGGRWEPIQSIPSLSPASQPKRPKMYTLSQDREISSIPRAVTISPSDLNSAERAALPANNEKDTGHDRDSGNWIYPSQEMFFNAMQRKGHSADPSDMQSIVPIHNAVNERAWSEIKVWERGWGGERCGGPKLVSFAGDSKALTPRARWKSMMGYTEPFDRHDWVIDRCGTKVEYVIDFYKGKETPGKPGGPLSFYLDVRPKLNSWEGIKMRAAKAVAL
ncbi:cytochrome c1 heme lyase [Lecanosticta acicola]|uniref:Holocytochrome c-type synthase n=1 Tax=Lecanosticta acicola TaxID=111012 RepID=A0AAI8Z5Z0_9PEZI|nr:cytochrome c1 heme lyase [Lecanosticta acicola]